MADESGASQSVVTRGLGAIRDAFTGQPDETEQGQADEEDSPTAEEETNDTSQPTAEEYADTMQQCAAGDLTVRMAEHGEDRAMDRIALEFNDMVSELEQTTDHLKSYVDEVEGAGVGVERSSETVRRASGDVVDSMQTISADIGEQREQLEAISETIDGVTGALEQVAASHPDADIEPQITRLEEQVSEIRDAAQTSESVETETQIVSAAVEEQAAELNDVSRRADDLQRYAKPLRAILDRFDTGSVSSAESPVSDRQD